MEKSDGIAAVFVLFLQDEFINYLVRVRPALAAVQAALAEGRGKISDCAAAEGAVGGPAGQPSTLAAGPAAAPAGGRPTGGGAEPSGASAAAGAAALAAPRAAAGAATLAHHYAIVSLEEAGFCAGARVCERLLVPRHRIGDPRECVKFLCKDVWTFLFRKQADRLQTNRRGGYVVLDNAFVPLRHVVFPESFPKTFATAAVSARALEAGEWDESVRLLYVCAVLRGALANLGYHCAVTGEAAPPPKCECGGRRQRRRTAAQPPGGQNAGRRRSRRGGAAGPPPPPPGVAPLSA